MNSSKRKARHTTQACKWLRGHDLKRLKCAQSRENREFRSDIRLIRATEGFNVQNYIAILERRGMKETKQRKNNAEPNAKAAHRLLLVRQVANVSAHCIMHCVSSAQLEIGGGGNLSSQSSRGNCDNDTLMVYQDSNQNRESYSGSDKNAI